MALNGFLDLAKEKLQQAQKVAKESMEKLKKELREKYLRIDSINNKIFLSDEALVMAIKLLVKFYAADLSLQIEPQAEGYLFTAEVKKLGKVVALIDLKTIAFEKEKLILTVSTPTGITVKDRPVVSYVLSFIAPVFTGTWVGKAILGEKFEGIVWDGNTATITVNLDKNLQRGTEGTGELAFLANISRENSWLRFEFSEKDAAEKFYDLLQENVIALLKEKFAALLAKKN